MTVEQHQPYSAPPIDPPASRPRSRRSAVLALIGAVVVAAVLVGGLVGRRATHTVQLRLDGRPVEAPAAALATAEARVFRVSSAQTVNSGHDDHCYFAVADGGTDISQGIYCGPLALDDSAAGANFLHFEVSGTQHGSRETITVADDPDRGGTQPLPIGYSLMRPGDSARHRHFAAVTDPLPTAAAPNVLVTTADVGPGQSRFHGAGSPIMIGGTGAVEVEELQTVAYFGTGASKRAAAPGHQLIAFKLLFHPFGQSTLDDLGLGVIVNGGSPETLPAVKDETQWVVASIPSDASTAELALTSDSGPQTVSLLDGRMGSNVIELYQRTVRQQSLDRDLTMPVTFGAADGSSEPATLRVRLDDARLVYLVKQTNGTEVHPSDRTTAWLHIELSYTDSTRPGKTYDEIGPPLQELRLPSGDVLQPTNVSTDGGVFYAYDVPAGFTGGSLVLGAGVERFADGGTETFGRRIEIPLQIPTD